MAVVTVEEGKHEFDDGFEAYTKTWKPSADNLRARLVFLHGFSDHCNNYDKFLPYLSERGIEVRAWDQRGWGKSVKKSADKGRTGPTSRVMADTTEFIEHVLADSTSPSCPVFLMGHSMGGAQALYYTTNAPSQIMSQIRGTIASAPLITLHPRTRPWPITFLVARLAVKVMPYYHLVNHLPAHLQSHDEVANKAWADDPLNHDTGTLEGLVDMFERSRVLDGEPRPSSNQTPLKVKEGIHQGARTRLLVCHGTEDQINSFDSSQRFVNKRCRDVTDVQFVPFKGRRHCMHLDTGYEEFRELVANWILERAGPIDGKQVTADLMSTSKL